MAYYLSGALASQASASVAQVLTASIYPAGGFYSYKNREWMNLALSPSGEYFAQSTLYGTGAYDINNETTSFSPSIVIWQSSSATGYSPVSEVKVKGATALNSNNVQYDVENLIGATFVSNTTIVHAVGAYDPQDGSSVQSYGTFLVITGSGATWGVSQALSATSNTTTAQAASRATPARWDEDSIVVTANNKHTSTDATRVAIHSTCDADGPSSTKQPRVTVYSQSGGTWAFHSQFSVNDFNGPLSTDTNVSIQDVTWIDEDLMGIVFQLDGSSSNLSYTTLVKYDGADWAAFGGNGKQVTMNSNDSYINHAASGIRMIEWDEVNERLYLQAAGTFYIWDSGSNWAADDFGGNTSVSNGAADSISLATTVSQDGPWQGPMFADFKFSTGNATLISTYPGNPSSYGDSEIVYAESGSSGWAQNLYSTNEYGYFTDTDISTSGFSPAIDSDANILKSSWRPVFGDHTGRTFAWNNLGGGDANTFIYREGGQDPSHGYDSGRAIVLDLGAFPGSNPGLSTAVSDTVGSSGGAVSAGGTQASPLATITIPNGALASNATIGVDLTGNDDARTNGINSSAGTVGLTAYSPVVEVTPHGQTFASAVTLSFQLTGAVAGTKPADLVIYKSLTADGPWYKLPSAFYACSNTGVITLTATSFSRYQAQGGNNMARTQLNNNQIAKLVKPNKAVARAIDLTGSLADQNGAAYISATDLLVLHRTGSQAQPVSASVLQDFFSKVDVVETGTDAAFQLLFADDDSVGGGDGVLRVDGSHLTYNPNSNLLSVGGDLNLGGHLVADADEAKNIFAAVTTAGNSITIGGGADIVLGGDLKMAAAGRIEDAGGHVRFTATDAGATILGAADGTAGLTLAANNSSVTIAGDLVVSGNDVTFGNGATIVNGDANTLTITEATLAVSADLNLGGHLVADADEAKNIFAAVTTAGNSITIGGGADIVLGGDLKMAAAGRIEDAGGHARFTATDSGATILGAADGTAGLTLAANNSSVTVAGDLTVNGNDLDFTAGNATIGESVGSANLTLGAGSSTVIIPGNLTVQGEVTSVDSTTINVSSSFTFEGFADAHETTLHAGGDGTGDTPQADTSIYLPALSAGNYFLPVLADKATAASSAVIAAEFALLDGASTVGTTALASGDGFLHNDAGTMRQTSIDKIADLFAGEGLASSAGVLNITGSGISAENIAVGADTFMFFDSDGSPKQESFVDLATAQAGAGLAASGGQLVVDVSEFSAVTPAASDSFLTLDSDGSTEQRTTTDALATLFAGSGMTASSAVISVANASNGGIAVAADDIKVDIDDLTAVTAIASGDTFAMAQQAESGDPTKKITFDNMAAKLGGAGLTPTAGVLAVVNASNGGIAVAADDIKVDIDDLTAVTAIASGDTFAIAQQAESGDPTKKITFDNMATKLAGDGLAATSGVLAIQSVQRSFQSASSAVTTGSAVNITDNYDSAIVEASFHVYLNGMLQTRSGSLEANQTIFDYEMSGTTLTLQSEMDSDDVLIVSYIKKS
jgi:hypothetical protein